MKKISWILGVTAVLALAFTSVQPAQAAMFKAPSKIMTGEGTVIEVRGGHRRMRRGGGYRGGRHYRGGRGYRGGRRYSRHRYKRRHYRRGYRPRYNYGYYRPGFYYGYGGNFAVGFIGGALIGAAIADSNRRNYDDYGYREGHYRWCRNRYRSYRPRTNTWTAYSGRVKQCRSPYN